MVSWWVSGHGLWPATLVMVVGIRHPLLVTLETWVRRITGADDLSNGLSPRFTENYWYGNDVELLEPPVMEGLDLLLMRHNGSKNNGVHETNGVLAVQHAPPKSLFTSMLEIRLVVVCGRVGNNEEGFGKVMVPTAECAAEVRDLMVVVVYIVRANDSKHVDSAAKVINHDEHAEQVQDCQRLSIQPE
ncbi:hypothetical protein M8C21_016180, partial [Ambrosia artemisiifolia]